MFKIEDIINRVHNADCLEFMKQMKDKSVDLVLTDPPYGIDFQSARPTENKRKDKIINDKLSDFVSIIDPFFIEVKRILKDGGCCCCCCCGGGGTPSLAHLWLKAGDCLKVENVLIWDKGFVGMGWRYRFQWEAILVATKGERKTWNGGNNKSNILKFQKIIPQQGDHPTPKPIDLMKQLILDNSNENDLILDPFLGSGTTAVAAKQLKRNFIGIEISPDYCKIANDRLRQEMLF